MAGRCCGSCCGAARFRSPGLASDRRGGWRHRNQHDGAFDRLGDSVRHIGGSPDHGSGSDFAGFLTDCHPRLSTYDQIKFVRSGVYMNLLGLARLETVQAHEELGAQEEIGFGCCVRAELDQ